MPLNVEKQSTVLEMLLINLKLTTQKYSKERRIDEKYNIKDQNIKLNKAEEFDDKQKA